LFATNPDPPGPFTGRNPGILRPRTVIEEAWAFLLSKILRFHLGVFHMVRELEKGFVE
jgi:hypothetical protein